MTEAAIAQIWQNINEVIELVGGKFNMKLLYTRQWYLQVLMVLFPFMEEEWNRIATQIQSQEAAIDRILLVLTQEGALPEEYLSQIKGKDIVRGNQETIMNLVQIMNEFVQQALEQDEKVDGEDQQMQNQQDVEGEYMGEDQLSAEYNQRMQEKPIVRNKSPMVTLKADSQPDMERNVKSVLGIGHQFQEEQEDMSEEQGQHNFDKLPEAFGVFGLTKTGNSSVPKGLKATDFKYEEDEEQYQQDQQDNYLHQKLNKCKSQDHLKNVPKTKGKKKRGKKMVTFVSYPTMEKQYIKAKTPAQKKFTRQVKSGISGSRKGFNKQNYDFGSPAGKNQINRKQRQVNYHATKLIPWARTREGRLAEKMKKLAKFKSQAQLSVNKVKKLMNWKQANIKRQKKQVQQNLEMRVQLKKQTYVKKINKLILNLEKEKVIETRKEERQRQRKEKQMAQARLCAIQQQYRDQMAMLNARSSGGKKSLARTDHRNIIQNLERQLKKQNEKHINSLKTKMKREEAQLDDDLEILQREIIRTYKKN